MEHTQSRRGTIHHHNDSEIPSPIRNKEPVHDTPLSPRRATSFRSRVDDSENSDLDSDDENHTQHHQEVKNRCGCYRVKNSKFRSLFWFNSPNFMLHLLQLLLLSVAIYITFYIVVFAKTGMEHLHGGSVPAVLIPALLTLFFFIPTVLPIYTLVILKS